MNIHHIQYEQCVIQSIRTVRSICRFVLLILLISTLLRANSAEAGGLDTSHDNWAVIGGYGQSIPGWGETTERVETLDLIPRYNHVIFDNIGSGWYQGYHSLLLEIPVSLVVSHDVSTILGVNFLAAYTFTAGQRWYPYIFGGGGPVYSFADVPGMGADFNGNYQFGIGLKYALQKRYNLLFELRYHHISNGGSKEPNDPLNSCKLLFGITF